MNQHGSEKHPSLWVLVAQEGSEDLTLKSPKEV